LSYFICFRRIVNAEGAFDFKLAVKKAP
jgi:hypothetical protein